MKKGTSYFKTAFKVIFTLVVLYFLFQYVSGDWERFKASVQQASPGWLVFAFLLVFTATLSNALAWKYILRILGADIDLLGSLRAYYFSVMAKYVPGKIWGFTARVVFSKAEGVPEGTGTLGIILETAFLIITATIISGLSVTHWPAQFPQWMRWLILVAPLSIIFLHPRLLTFVMHILRKRFPRHVTVPDKHLRFRVVLQMAWIYCSIWVLYGGGYFFVLKSLHLVTADDFGLLIGASAFAWVGGNVIAFSPAGLGVREFILVAMSGDKVGPAAATMAAVCIRIFIVFGEGLGALILKFFHKGSNNA